MINDYLFRRMANVKRFMVVYLFTAVEELTRRERYIELERKKGKEGEESGSSERYSQHMKGSIETKLSHLKDNLDKYNTDPKYKNDIQYKYISSGVGLTVFTAIAAIHQDIA